MHSEPLVFSLSECAFAGLAASAGNAEGLRKIYAIKQRRQGLPLAICVATAGDVGHYGEVGHLPEQLLDKLLPGPVTLLLRRKPESPLADELNPGLETIGNSPQISLLETQCLSARGASSACRCKQLELAQIMSWDAGFEAAFSLHSIFSCPY